MEELSFEQMETTQGGKFWGKGGCTRDGDTYTATTNGLEECWQDWECSYFMFWIPVSRSSEPGGC